MRFKNKLFLTAQIILFPFSIQALNYTDIQANLSEVFYQAYDKNEGTTSFRSLMIPFGGRGESLAGSYTGLCDDITYLRYNPSAGAIQNQTQLSLFHNSWIADSKQETLAYTTRLSNLQNFSYGGFISCFYVPFTEYNLFGDRVAANYYSETVAALNFSYNFLAGYNFRGISVGGNLKAGWRGMPDYTDNDTDAIIPNSGLEQSSFAIMADFGMMLQFNFLKYYSSRDANVRIGISAQNFGIGFTGFGSEKGIQKDDPLPSTLAAGMSLKFIKPITLSVEYTQPIDLDNQLWLVPFFGTGVSIEFTSFLSLLSGFQFKGGNPRFSLGLEFEIYGIRFNANYTLDFTTSFNPINKLSVSTKIMLGDKGRSEKDALVDSYYIQGLQYYATGDWQAAIDSWNEALKINKRFDPAISGIKSAQYQIDMFEKIRNSLLFDQ